MEKRRGASASLYLAKDGLPDEVGYDAIPDAAGGKGHDAAKPQGAVPRCPVNHGQTATRVACC